MADQARPEDPNESGFDQRAMAQAQRMSGAGFGQRGMQTAERMTGFSGRQYNQAIAGLLDDERAAPDPDADRAARQRRLPELEEDGAEVGHGMGGLPGDCC